MLVAVVAVAGVLAELAEVGGVLAELAVVAHLLALCLVHPPPCQA